MATDPTTPRSRRAILAAAAGSAAAVAASTVLPAGVAAVPLPVTTEQTTTATDMTGLTQTTDGKTGLNVITTTTVSPNTLGTGAAVAATNTSVGTAAVVALIGDTTNAAPDTSYTGAYGFSPTNPDPSFVGAGVWGDSDDWGVYGTGGVGVFGDGFYGVVGRSDAVGGAGVLAVGSDTDVALSVTGKVLFSRAGRVTIGAGRSSIRVTKLGVSTNSRIFAVLGSNRTGRYVRAVVPATGSFTIYLNLTVTAATYVMYFIIN